MCFAPSLRSPTPLPRVDCDRSQATKSKGYRAQRCGARPRGREMSDHSRSPMLTPQTQNTQGVKKPAKNTLQLLSTFSTSFKNQKHCFFSNQTPRHYCKPNTDILLSPKGPFVLVIAQENVSGFIECRFGDYSPVCFKFPDELRVRGFSQVTSRSHGCFSFPVNDSHSRRHGTVLCVLSSRDTPGMIGGVCATVEDSC
jgi:hypothetical protein